MRNESGIYVHIPFCRRFCFYCNFTKINYSEKSESDYTRFLLEEITLRRDRNLLINSIYLGGGSPSIIKASSIAKIVDCISSNFKISKDCEITIELNPEDITGTKLRQYKETGINRLSVGVQSFDEADLKFLGREHDRKRSMSAIKLIQDRGFDNVSIDLIIGIPDQTEKSIRDNIMLAEKFNITHISVYILEGKKAEKKFVPDYEDQAEKYDFTRKILEETGFEQYEVSNFCKNKLKSVHNMKYWTGERYIGCGISATGFNGSTEYKNLKSLNSYYSKLEEKSLPVGEIISPNLKKRRIITGLRLTDGINEKLLSHKKEETKFLLSNGVLKKIGGNIVVSPDKFSVLNEVILNLI